MREDDLLSRCTFPSAEHVFCAVSGGADSLALLVLARSAGLGVTAVHVDHGLRRESADEAEMVASAAKRFGAQFVSEKVRVEPGPNLEARARSQRYAVLPRGVLTGHTADDQAETVLLNIMRGSGLDGLAGMRSTCKPILQLRRHETRALCNDLRLSPVHDASNDDLSLRRNHVRHELLPLMRSIAQRDVAAVIARQTMMLREDADLLEEMARDVDVSDARSLRAAPGPIARRAVRAWVREVLDGECHPPDAATVERVLAVARGQVARCDLVNGFSVRRSRQRLMLVSP